MCMDPRGLVAIILTVHEGALAIAAPFALLCAAVLTVVSARRSRPARVAWVMGGAVGAFVVSYTVLCHNATVTPVSVEVVHVSR